MKYPFRIRLAFVALVAFFSLLPYAARSENGAPRAVIDGFHETLLGVMKDGPGLGYKGRYERLLPAVKQTFHLPVMIQIASGSLAWKQATPAQQQALLAAWTQFSTGTYAKNFKSHGGERFETIGQRPGPQNTTLVDTKIVKSDGSAVEITYVFRESSEGWRVVDVIVDKGISELAVRRSEFSRLIKDGGPDALIASLDRKAAEYAEQTP